MKWRGQLAIGLAMFVVLVAVVIPGVDNSPERPSAICAPPRLVLASHHVHRGGRIALTGRACPPEQGGRANEPIALRVWNHRRWVTEARAKTDAEGVFASCVRVRLPRTTLVARLEAVSPSGTSPPVAARIARRGGPSDCPKRGQDPGDPAAAAGYQVPAPDHGNPDCPLTDGGPTVGLTLPASCTVVAEDTASAIDPLLVWGKLDCATASRHQRIATGGDPHTTGLGEPQGNTAFRRLTVVDGDDVYGERCELGFNNWSGPTALYHEGRRRVTFISLRIPGDSDIEDPRWRTVMQMKQAQGYRNPDQSPILEMQVRDGRWWVGTSWHAVWDAPAEQDTWTRFAFDITYSQNPSVGTIKIYVDLNGDGDANDAGEQSPVVHIPTLRAETAGAGYSDYAVGQSIPDHLRAGIYEDPSYECPSGCSVDVDNVQVISP